MDAATPTTSAGPSTSTSMTTSSTQQTQPKIDPLRLLNCLSILLNPRGGIKGVAEVHRVKGLMTKYSKKLVSKCIYLNILQATDTPLLDLFYEEGGWELVGAWLQEAVIGRNWPLATQVLTLMESSPLSLARLKRNSTPKLVKDLSRLTQASGVHTVAKRLVQKWMEVVRQGDCVAGLSTTTTTTTTNTTSVPVQPYTTVQTTSPVANNRPAGPVAVAPSQVQTPAPVATSAGVVEGGEGSSSADDESSNASTESEPAPPPAATTPIRITIRSGSQVLAKVTSQRPSQDSTDSDDNKPLSVLREEVQQSRSSPDSGAASPSSTFTTTTTTSTTTITSTATTTSSTTSVGPLPAATTAAGAVHTIVTFTTGHSNPIPIPVSLPATTTTVNTTSDKNTSAEPTSSTTTTTTKDDTDTIPAVEEPTAAAAAAEDKTSSGSEEGGSLVNGEATPGEKLAAEGKTGTKRGRERKTRERDKGKSKDKEKEEKDKDKEKEEKDKDKEKEEKDKDKEKEEKDKDEKDKDKEEKKEREKRSERRDKERSKGSSSSKSSDKDKERDKSKGSRSDRHRSSRDKDKRDKDRKSSSSSSSSSSSRKSSSKDKDRDKDRDKDKEKEKEKDKDKEKKRQESEDKATLEKVKPLPVDGLAKIPRKAAPPTFLDALGSADADMKQVRKPSSVKTYKSRGFRNTGLLDEPALPPKKTGEKKGATTTTPGNTSVKRAPLDDLSLAQPDKRVRSSVSSQPLNADKPGGVKLISPKRPSLSDDGGFMAALTAAGTERKKVTRKRKSSESENKDGPANNKSEEDGPASPTNVNNAAAKDEKGGMMSPTNVRPTFNFYQETLKSDDEKGEKEEGKKEETEENEEDMEAKEEGDEDSKMDVDNSEKDEPEDMDTEGGDDEALRDEDIPLAPAVPAPAQEEYETVEVTFSAPDPGTVRGVLVYHRSPDRRRKSVKWRPEDDLQEVFYFEMDETERVNVNTVKFNELMAMEKQRERENMMGKGRGLGRLDLMNKGIGGHHNAGGRLETASTFMRWSLLPVMLTGQPNVVVGARSQEKHTQAARQTSTMPAFYHPSTLPETPKEPDPEMVVRAEPKEIPLNDVLGQDNLHDHRDKFWPEPLMSEPPPYPPYPMGGGMPPAGGARGGGSHWVIGGGGPPAPAYGGGPMYGGSGPMPVGPGGPGPIGYAGPAGYGGDMGEGMDGWGGPGPDYPGQNMMMMGGGQNVMMAGHPSMGGPRNMMPNMGMGGGPRFRGRQGGNWSNSGRPPPICRHFMNGHCKHGKSCKYMHPSPH